MNNLKKKFHFSQKFIQFVKKIVLFLAMVSIVEIPVYLICPQSLLTAIEVTVIIAVWNILDAIFPLSKTI